MSRLLALAWRKRRALLVIAASAVAAYGIVNVFVSWRSSAPLGYVVIADVVITIFVLDAALVNNWRRR